MKYYFDPEFEKGYKEYRLKKYRGCNHFLVHFKDVSYNKRIDNCYVCIKCEINEVFKYDYYNQFDGYYMLDYLKEYKGVIPGFRSKTNLLPCEACDIYKEVIKENPNITNEELENILIEKEKGLLESKGISISRRKTSFIYSTISL